MKVITTKSGKVCLPKNSKRYTVFDRIGTIVFTGHDLDNYKCVDNCPLWLYDKLTNKIARYYDIQWV